jgi:hypothetical protein
MQLLIDVPDNIVLEETILFASSLQNLPVADEYIFNFKNVRRMEPFALLILSSEIQRCRSSRPHSRFTATNYDQNSYAAHMGFYRAFGVEYGKAPGEALGSGTYIPIKLYDTTEIRELAAKEMVAPAILLEEEAKNMSKIITRSSTGALYEVMVYCLREILRNVLEHSQSMQFGMCAQYWPSLNKVSLAILDRGRGIQESLSQNPYLSLNDDADALAAALQPGISGTFYKGAYVDPDDAWANSGYGLYMTSQICREGGSFFVASGSTGLYLSENKHRFLPTPFRGTALNLTLITNRLQNLESTLEKFRVAAKQSGASSPSASSRGLMSKSRFSR